jgi:hypothetical protein
LGWKSKPIKRELLGKVSGSQMPCLITLQKRPYSLDRGRDRRSPGGGDRRWSMRVGCEEDQRVAYGWRRIKGSTGGPRARRIVRQTTRLARRSARARHERERCEERPTARMSRNDSRITNGTKENRTSAEAPPGDIRSNQADRDPRLRDSGRRM